jgi:acyl carrier protein
MSNTFSLRHLFRRTTSTGRANNAEELASETFAMTTGVDYGNTNASLEAGTCAGATADLADDDTTLRLAHIWEKLLGVESVGLDENYFDLGGDSILTIQLFVQIEKVFKVKLPVATLFDAPTVEELAIVVRRELSAFQRH